MALVPSREIPNGSEALARMLPEAKYLNAAVAFVTHSGVDVLERLFAERGAPETLRFIVRGAPISEPSAIQRLATEFDADVRVVLGREALRFHPKFWISGTTNFTRVLSGSGNLTAGGLVSNAEQFELLTWSRRQRTAVGGVTASDHGESDQLQRWQQFWRMGVPLSRAVASPAWTAWELQAEERSKLEVAQAQLDGALVGLAGEDSESAEAAEAAGGRGQADEATIRGWLQDWYPDRRVRETVCQQLADAAEAAHDLRPRGWVACAPLSSHGGQPRIELLVGNAQVMVARPEGSIIFEAAPQHVSPEGHLAAGRVSGLPGVRSESWGQAGARSLVVPGARAEEAYAAGGREAILATIEWRAPRDAAGNAAHRARHCAEVIDVLADLTGRRLQQPSYLQIADYTPSMMEPLVLRALHDLGRPSTRRDVVLRAAQLGGFSKAELSVPRTYKSSGHEGHIHTICDYAVWQLRDRHQMIERVERGVYVLTQEGEMAVRANRNA